MTTMTTANGITDQCVVCEVASPEQECSGCCLTWRRDSKVTEVTDLEVAQASSLPGGATGVLWAGLWAECLMCAVDGARSGMDPVRPLAGTVLYGAMVCDRCRVCVLTPPPTNC